MFCKKFLLFMWTFIACLFVGTAQVQKIVITENFDGQTVSFNATPANSWTANTDLYATAPKSYWAETPSGTGNEVILESPVYDFTDHPFVYLRFKHICKVSPRDEVRLEYKTAGAAAWQPVPADAYWGVAADYWMRGFNASSYLEWNAADSTALPTQSWWKNETFDLSFFVGYDHQAQFRFVIKKGNVSGTQISYGWLIDDVEITASPDELRKPLVELVAPFPTGNVSASTPFTIYARALTNTAAPITQPWLHYTSSNNNVLTIDSLPMLAQKGDTLWANNLPIFPVGTQVSYFVIGKDTIGNSATAAAGFTVTTSSTPAFDTNSVALAEFVSPVLSLVAAADITPVTVVLHNKGINDLDSVTIHWKVNGVLQPTLKWNGKLPWNLKTTVSLGTYISRTDDYDTILVWVTLPNGKPSANTTDDTITIMPYGCLSGTSGIFQVGSASAHFTDWSRFVNRLKNCSASGDITLEFQTETHTQAMNLGDISNYMNGYKLTLTSQSGDAQDAIIKTSGTAITLRNNEKIVIKDLTIDVSASANSNGISLSESCDSILIRDCHIFCDTISASPTGAPIYKSDAAYEVLSNTSIVNNLLVGGGYGIRIGATYGTDIVVDSNEIRNPTDYGCRIMNANFTSFAHNSFVSNRVKSGWEWRGMLFSSCTGPVVGNRIHVPGTVSNKVLGIEMFRYNEASVPNGGLFANNEIILNSSSDKRGFYIENSSLEILHNSIFCAKATTSKGMEILSYNNNLQTTIKYNNIVILDSNSYPLQITGQTYQTHCNTDYNNLYSPQYIGYLYRQTNNYLGEITTLQQWQSVIPTDKGSFRSLPTYVDHTQSLELTNYGGFAVPISANVHKDINGIVRDSLTNAGCYHGILSNVDVMLTHTHGLRYSAMLGDVDTLKVIVVNGGLTPVTTITFDWEVDAVPRTPFTWTGNLPVNGVDTIAIGLLNYAVSGNINLKINISSLGSLTDNNKNNDTIKETINVCDSLLRGVYTIGSSASNHFASMDEAQTRLMQCGVSGDITFAFDAETHNQGIDLSNISDYTNGYKLTLTSQSGTAAGTTIKVNNGSAIRLNNSNNIVISALTIESDGSAGIIFGGPCTNVVVRDCDIACRIITATAFVPGISKVENVGFVDSIFIIGNTITGGSHGIYFEAGTNTNYGKNLFIDSNTILKAYERAIYVRYSSFRISANTISADAGSVDEWQWRGMEIRYSNGDIIGNRIRIPVLTADLNANGMLLINVNVYQTQDTALVANNEIILHANTSNLNSRGMHIEYSRAKILYNSIYCAGNNRARGMHLDPNTAKLEVKYNNIEMIYTGSHPIYVMSTNHLPYMDIDHNNLHAPEYVGYAGANRTSIADWQSIITTDKKSFSTAPPFVNPTQNLKMSSYSGFSAFASTHVPMDLEGANRIPVTNIGCYHGVLENVDLALVALVGLRSGMIFGQNDMLRAVVVNSGQTTLDTILIQWKLNNAPQTPKKWVGSLPAGATDTIDLGIVNYTPAGVLAVEVYIDSIGTIHTDNNKENDTLRALHVICNGSLNGTYAIGSSAGAHFANINDALTSIIECGVNGDITLAFEPETHTRPADLTNVSDYMNGYTLTLTSQSGTAGNTTIEVNGGPCITLNKSSNIVIRALTIENKGSDNSFGILLKDSASNNILVRDCRIFVDTNTQYMRVVPIIKDYNSKPSDNIAFINNIIRGGFCGIEFHGNVDNQILSTHVVIDSNTISNGTDLGIRVDNTAFQSLAYNTVSSRYVLPFNWTGIDLAFCVGDVRSNRIHVLSPCTKIIVGISLNHQNYENAQDNGLIYNNEIMLNSSVANSRGISIGGIPGGGMLGLPNTTNTNTKILNNSIYCFGSGVSRGIQVNIADNTSALTVKYNNIVMMQNGSFPIYIDRNPALISQWQVDYNNLYAPQNVGFINSAQTSIAAWQSAVPSDNHSVKVFPVFDDTDISLEIANHDSLQCPLDAGINKDILDKPRFSITQMGAYTFGIVPFDMALMNITNQTAVLNQRYYVEVDAVNAGTELIDNALLKWSKNGVYQGSFLWTASPQMASEAIQTIQVGNFFFDGTPTQVKVWIDSVNNKRDTINWNDTVEVTITQNPLARFVDPLVADTINTVEFDVYTLIEEGSGALYVQPTPKLYIETYLGTYVFYDSIVMNFVNGKWIANIPPQYFNSKVVYTLHVTDTVNNTLMIKDSTFIKFESNSKPYTLKNLTISSVDGLDFGNTGCLPDSTFVNIDIINTGNQDIDFSQDNLSLRFEVTHPITFLLDTVINVGGIPSGGNTTITLTNGFPIHVAGQYDIVISQALSGDQIVYDDTIKYDYVSGRFGLPIDDDFSDSVLSFVFNSNATVGIDIWRPLHKDSILTSENVIPQFGDGVLAFNGSIGSMASLYTRQLDLSQTVQPNLSFWYFHDTVPCRDYMDVRVTIDGGTTFSTLISLRKQNEVRGWQQYSMDLPLFAVNQCVFIVFEAMEKDPNGQIWQYIDRIRMTAKQDLAITSIYADTTACDMNNKDWKIVLSNLTDPVIYYSQTPINLTLEVQPSGLVYTKLLNNDVLGSFSLDTIVIPAGINLERGTYSLTAYFESILDDNRDNDTLYSSFVVNPHLHLDAQPKSSGTNCLGSGTEEIQTFTITNDGNMVMENVVVVLETHNGQGWLAAIYDTLPNALYPGQSIVHTMTKPYIVPGENFYVNIFAMLTCGKLYSDSAFLSECIDEDDLRIVELVNMPAMPDQVGASLPLEVRLRNISPLVNFSNVKIHAFLNDGSSNVYAESATILNIASGSDYVHAFPNFTVPNVSSYTILVYIETKDNAPLNDTLRMVRQTSNSVIGMQIEGASMSQNIPNPADKTTRVVYSIPADGTVIFNVYSVLGQSMFIKTVDAVGGTHSIDFDITNLAAGIYYYSMDYKGQRVVKKMNVQK